MQQGNERATHAKTKCKSSDMQQKDAQANRCKQKNATAKKCNKEMQS